ncbi:MAG: N-glycosylase/DNA lyase [Endomicrobium sp.]|jgi:N-glycosylase/DNA lyase|nr:N-glycosylase/DNA lyase [Endomicrobium sp.]
MKNNLIQINFLKTPVDSSTAISGLKKFWKKVFPIISNREKHFDEIWKNGTDEEIFAELVFCLFTPQSKATWCWNAVNELVKKNMIFNSKEENIIKIIKKVRFRNNKAKYLIEARKMFVINGRINLKEKLKSFKDTYKLRKWLAENIKGIGYKEASHFLRNIGIGKNLAILDRHVLKSLKIYGAIKGIPLTLNKKTYLKTEKQMQHLSKNTGIPMSHLDMLFWCKNTGGIFK